MIRKIIVFLLTIFSIASIGITSLSIHSRSARSSDTYIRDAVVLLRGEHGSCSGVQVEIANKAVYVLTAAHCELLQNDAHQIKGVSESGEETMLSIIKIDDKSDLMMLSGSAIFRSITVAASLELHEHVHTMTHGAGAPAYRTDGEALDIGGIQVNLGEITTPEQLDKCLSRSRNTIVLSFMGVYCVMDVVEQRTTTTIIPGSSGGPLLNAAGELVGIVSAGNPQQPMFGYFVLLSDIQEFLKTAI